MVLEKIKRAFSKSRENDLISDDYLELNLEKKKKEKKVLLR